MSLYQYNKKPKHGKIQGDTFRKEASSSRHMLRAPRAWCIDQADLETVERMGVERIEINDLETGTFYSTSLETFKAHSFPVRRGFGEQRGLELRHWNITAPLRTGKDAAKQSQQLPRQMSLFEGVRHE